MRSIPRVLVLPLVLALDLAACRSVGWEGDVKRWGSMHEVMAEGAMGPRVRLVDASRADVVGIGALAGLEGEISIVDGTTWVTRSRTSTKLDTTSGAAAGGEATLLVTATVHEWVGVQIDREIDLADLVAWSGLDALGWDVVPFVVKGRLVGLDAHVLHGACPFAGDVPPDKAPVRKHASSAFGTLVGFWARDGAGTITHRGEHVHAHAVVQGDDAWTAHVDRVRIGTGSTLYLPRGRERVSKGSLLRRTY